MSAKPLPPGRAPRPPATDWAGAPFWMRHTVALVRAAYCITAAATLIEAIRMIAHHASIVALVGLVALMAGAVLSWWRPLAGLAGVAAGCLLMALGGWDPLTSWTIATFLAFVACVRTAASWRVPLALAPALYIAVAVGEDIGAFNPLGFIAALLASTAAASGTSLRVQRAYWGALRQRTLDAIATRDLVADGRVGEERLRIARDLHDVLGHQIAVATTHLGVAEVRTPPDASEAHTALQLVRSDLRAVLTETQQILGILRRGEHPHETTSPTPGLADLGVLIASYRELGLAIEAELLPTPSISPIVDVTAYRVAQEALTNAHRYGDGTARLQIVLHDNQLEVAVGNPHGAAATPSGGGYGLVGMRERVESLKGRLTIQDDGSRFVVSASFPTAKGGIA